MSHDAFQQLVASIEGRSGYTRPAAFAIGIATFSGVAATARILDTWYPTLNLGENAGTAALLADLVGHQGGSRSYALDGELLERLLVPFTPFFNDGKRHANLETIRGVRAALRAPVAGPGQASTRGAVATFIGDLTHKPVDAHDVYLRLHLLSSRKVRPHGLNLEGIFGLLNNVCWTSHGPIDPEHVEGLRLAYRASGTVLSVHSVDKFPRMTDYVVPGGVRIADADRVRLGAHLGEGTTVMHEGFCNFNAGTLGKAMVEGRISAGVVVGNGSDIGGGASIMGTLSGGGKQVISIGEGCLLGANAGLGISLGNQCTVESGLYLTAGTKVRLSDGNVVKAATLSGQDGLVFRRHSQSGAVEARAAVAGGWGGLNAALHAPNP